ncbi:MAG TPA: hypothetical protein VLY24_14750 [Bryobacteraceae bacterium]|nr:hypothetical protein [Bryobacteraceae bacterium]
MPNPTTEPIRQAVASGEYQLAERLWNGYIAGLKELLRSGTLTKEILEEAGELVEWSRVTVLCMRAHAQGRLGSLHIAEAYHQALPSQAPRLIVTQF